MTTQAPKSVLPAGIENQRDKKLKHDLQLNCTSKTDTDSDKLKPQTKRLLQLLASITKPAIQSRV